MSTTAVEIPGYVAGTYTIDPGHSDVAFTVRHLMVSKVRGHFTRFQGELTLAPDPLASTVTASIEPASIDTNNPQRDDDLTLSQLLRDRHLPDDDLPLHRHPPRRGRLRCRRRADLAPGDPAGHPGPGRQRLHPRPLRRHPGRLLGHHRAQPGRLRHQHQHPWTAAGWSSATASRSSSRSKPSSTHPGRATPSAHRRPPGGRQPLPRLDPGRQPASP
jgi:hypothetical protein